MGSKKPISSEETKEKTPEMTKKASKVLPQMLKVLNVFGVKEKVVSHFLFKSPKVPKYNFKKIMGHDKKQPLLKVVFHLKNITFSIFLVSSRSLRGSHWGFLGAYSTR